PGSVKQARVEASLSLAQLGKGRVTAPAIYLIETGRTRPSLPTLEHIARRTGKPVEYFLAAPAGAADEGQASLIALEAMVADGRNHEAIPLGLSLLDRGSSAFRLGRIRYFLAQAYLGVGQPDQAATLLADARAHFEAVNDGVMLAECIGAQAALANMTHSKDSLQLAELAVSVCRGLKPVPAPTLARLLGILDAGRQGRAGVWHGARGAGARGAARRGRHHRRGARLAGPDRGPSGRARRGRPRVRGRHPRLRGAGSAREAVALPRHLRRDPRAARGAGEGLRAHEGGPPGEP